MINRAALKIITDAIDGATAPAVMGPGEALEFLEELQHNIETRIEAIHEDMRRLGQDWG